jgi:arsenate reductase (glutaredoxin)
MAPLSVLPTYPLTLFHDPNSPDSEYAYEALQLGSHQFDVRRIDLATSAPSADELRDLADRLVGDPVDALVRRGATYDSLALQLDDAPLDEVLDTLAAHPDLLHAPILDDGTDVMIGHPIDRAEAWAVTGHVVDAAEGSSAVLRAA